MTDEEMEETRTEWALGFNLDMDQLRRLEAAILAIKWTGEVDRSPGRRKILENEEDGWREATEKEEMEMREMDAEMDHYFQELPKVFADFGVDCSPDAYQFASVARQSG